MRTRDYQKKMLRRIARAEADANATILRAFDRVLNVLQREKTEYLIRKKRLQKPKETI